MDCGRSGDARDITARKRSEQALFAQFEQLSTILDSLSAVVYVADLQTYELLFINPYAAQLFGADSIGKPCFEKLQVGQTGQCAFCTNHLLVRDGLPQSAHARLGVPKHRHWVMVSMHRQGDTVGGRSPRADGNRRGYHRAQDRGAIPRRLHSHHIARPAQCIGGYSGARANTRIGTGQD